MSKSSSAKRQARRLKAALKTSGKSLGSIARETALSRRTLCRVFNGQCLPHRSTAFTLSKFLGLSIAQIRGLE
jgi:lambda repressor-like predicted transcriptional regulator